MRAASDLLRIPWLTSRSSKILTVLAGRLPACHSLCQPDMWYIFEKRIDRGYENLYSRVSNAQIQKVQIRKYTNTVYDKVPERPNMWHIFEKRIVQGYTNFYSHVSNRQIQQ